MASPVEIFTAAVEALNADDREAMVRIIDPQIAFVPLRAATTGAYLGQKGLEEFLAENAERFASYQAEFDVMRELSDGRLLAIGNIHMCGKDGAEMRYPTAGIATFRDDRLASWHDYGNEDAALNAWQASL